MFDNAEDFNVAVSQSLAIAQALGTLEDKLYWVASTTLGQTWMMYSEDGQMPAELVRLIEMNNDLFCQSALGVVHLPTEYKAIINQMVEKVFTPAMLDKQRKAVSDVSNLIGEMFSDEDDD